MRWKGVPSCRSADRSTPLAMFFWIASTSALSTPSWLSLHCLASSATLHEFKTCIRFWHSSWHQGHFLLSLFLSLSSLSSLSLSLISIILSPPSFHLWLSTGSKSGTRRSERSSSSTSSAATNSNSTLFPARPSSRSSPSSCRK